MNLVTIVNFAMFAVMGIGVLVVGFQLAMGRTSAAIQGGFMLLAIVGVAMFLPSLTSTFTGSDGSVTTTPTTVATSPLSQPAAPSPPELSEPRPQASSRPAPVPAPAEPIDWTLAVYIAAAAVATVGTIGAGWLARSGYARRRARRRAQAEQRQAQLERWQFGVATFNATSEALMDFELKFESDYEDAYFGRPLLGDINEPATAAFWTAYNKAQSLFTETIPTDDAAITGFVDAATAARRAFTQADDNARRKARQGIVTGGHKLTPSELRKLSQARNLMAQAHDASATPEFARTAHTKALDLLDSIGLSIPERLVSKTVLAIEQAHRPALTA